MKEEAPNPKPRFIQEKECESKLIAFILSPWAKKSPPRVFRGKKKNISILKITTQDEKSEVNIDGRSPPNLIIHCFNFSISSIVNPVYLDITSFDKPSFLIFIAVSILPSILPSIFAVSITDF